MSNIPPRGERVQRPLDDLSDMATRLLNESPARRAVRRFAAAEARKSARENGKLTGMLLLWRGPPEHRAMNVADDAEALGAEIRDILQGRSPRGALLALACAAGAVIAIEGDTERERRTLEDMFIDALRAGRDDEMRRRASAKTGG